MGILIQYPCGCEIDTWFTFDIKMDPVKMITMNNDDSTHTTFCKEHEHIVRQSYEKMLNRMLTKYQDS